ncbi:deacetylase [Candidatus Epulonipiscium fishelsonii]|uniref:Deacetylase n=1 Tax=Candidatus Epulonipiscium fishelsonii TaxID=77094 RepID=A0ACC8XGI5_9FIRM|nr:deacetylase [Epulopiscium sp. SCG-B05WGA-EpuloA1]ONI42622.1 deacetylase [Epulopiscium sp. SCG-B11WGA-EpuloA1]ONI47244.1 deacetylase [Epulopiscium sp. SCG-C06WGA-EpuloA1]
MSNKTEGCGYLNQGSSWKIFFGVILISSCNFVTYNVQAQLLPIYSVETEEKLVSLTFDVAWGDEDMLEILDILEIHGIKATFFIVGDWAEKYPHHVKTILEKGHDVGNHSYNHPHVNKISKDEIKEDIMKAHEVIKEIADYEMDLYRPPYGEYNDTVIEAANECNYYTVQWDVDSLDWKRYGLQPLIDKVLNHKNLNNGSIVLLHTGTEYTSYALDDIIKGLILKGYQLVPISQLIIRDNYRLDHLGRQHLE